jgi:anti-sigma factor RsiW
MTAELTCRDFIEFLMDYLDGSLPADQWSRFEAHIEDCPSCVDYLESYRATSILSAEALLESSAELSDEVPEELVRAVLAARSRDSE